MSQIDKALKAFEYTTEWSDLIAALEKLNKVLLAHQKLMAKMAAPSKLSARTNHAITTRQRQVSYARAALRAWAAAAARRVELNSCECDPQRFIVA